jgi:phage shock protein E
VQEILRAGAVIVDVRTGSEYRAGHIQGSINIPLDRISGEIDKIRGLKKAVITVCRSGNRSSVARNILKTAGIEAYNGGAWTNLKAKA